MSALAPGWFPSGMTCNVLSHPLFLNSMRSITPIKRIGDPTELTGPLLLPASDASSFMTCHTLVVDGGISCGIGVPELPEDFLKLVEERGAENPGRRIGKK